MTDECTFYKAIEVFLSRLMLDMRRGIKQIGINEFCHPRVALGCYLVTLTRL